MARMHTRRKGKSSSKKPVRDSPPEWLDIKKEEVEKLVVELYDQVNSSSMVGMILRDRYGVPSVRLVTGKKIMDILKENNVAPAIPEDMQNLIKKALRLRKHLESNKKDYHNKRALQLTESKIRRLMKYYKREGVLPEDWEYKPEIVEILLRT